MSMRHIEVHPAELKSGDVLPYHLREEVKRVEPAEGSLVYVHFTGGRTKVFDNSVFLTALRAA